MREASGQIHCYVYTVMFMYRYNETSVHIIIREMLCFSLVFKANDRLIIQYKTKDTLRYLTYTYLGLPPWNGQCKAWGFKPVEAMCYKLEIYLGR